MEYGAHSVNLDRVIHLSARPLFAGGCKGFPHCRISFRWAPLILVGLTLNRRSSAWQLFASRSLELVLGG